MRAAESARRLRSCSLNVAQGERPGAEAIRLVGSLEGIVLDPVYAGRSMAALIDLIRKEAFRSDETVLFWHTAPALVAYAKDLI